MKLEFILSDCDCKINIPIQSKWIGPINYLDELSAYMNFKTAYQTKDKFAVHYRSQHIVNVFVNGTSIRRIG